ncbi:MAG: hemolysin family protein [Spirochaetes bacterium]|nr:hemolysin family protein [Spirochaetota bacterium]
MASDEQKPSKLKNNSLLVLLKEKLNKLKLYDKKNSSPSKDSLAIQKQEMIQGILSLSTKNVREVMIPRVDINAVEESISLKELVKLIIDEGHSRIPVYSGTIDNITGILYVKDLMPFIIDRRMKFNIKKLLHKPYFVPETMTLDDLLLQFQKQNLHLAIVVDEYGGVAGIVTLEDILEEIVGEIRDEFDEDETPEIQNISKNSWEVDSRLSISDFNEHTGCQLPDQEFDTIGGFVFDLFGKIPKKDEQIKYSNISFKIKDIKGTRIGRIIVTVTPQKNSDTD